MILAILLLLQTRTTFGSAQFPYGSPAFRTFVQDSLGEEDPSFYRWFEESLRQKGYGSVDKLMSYSKDPKAMSAKLHEAIKKAIPKFSLERGFEFRQTVSRGERQCFLQSVLLAGLMQRSGFDAGVAMVWKNDKGSTSNNGHAVPIVRTKEGDLIVDCSDPTPFMKHQGLYVVDRTGNYRFVRPHYKGDAINAYLGDGPVGAHGLGLDFLRSQFDFYRGERAPGGFMAAPKTASGLAASARYLERAQKECPENALAVYVLGRVYARQGKAALARKQYERAGKLYQAAGWMPQGVKDALTGK
ncbi:tetratricopeptide repeat protein [bacterium]|nr:MAG: tetratricopeptide repeat protein [bacterium]